MKQIKNTAILMLGLTLTAGTHVFANEATVKQAINLLIPSLKIESVKPSEAKGIYEVTAGTNILYVSEDGKHLLQGHLIDIEAGKDLTEEKLARTRKLAIEKLGENQMIVFKPENSKYKVSIFTDVDCGYCRKLHAEMNQYLAEGITVRYLFFPRAGKGSDSYNKAVSVWCADDRLAELTSAKKGNTPVVKTCDNPVDEHMQLGNDFETRGTPMIVTEKGNILPGYVPAKKLASILSME